MRSATFCIQEGQYGVLASLYRSTCYRRCTRRWSVNIPLNDAGTTKMKASADELQAVIDETMEKP